MAGRLLMLVLGLCLAAARPATADLFGYYNATNYGHLYTDERPGGIVTGDNAYGNGDSRLSTAAGEFDIIDGGLELTSGPFVSESFDGSEYTDVFGAGGVLDADWIIALPDGSTREINFSADLGVLTIEWATFGSTDGSGSGRVSFVGRLDADDAAFLGFSTRKFAGDWEIFLDHWDYLDEGPDDRGFAMYGEFDAVPVPEPSIAVLLVAGLLLRKSRARR